MIVKIKTIKIIIIAIYPDQIVCLYLIVATLLVLRFLITPIIEKAIKLNEKTVIQSPIKSQNPIKLFIPYP